MKPEDPGSNTLDSDADRRDLEVRLRRVAHDINGALNTLLLNVELLERALAAADAAAAASAASDNGLDSGRDAAGRKDSPTAARERCLGTVRRAAGEIQQIVGHRLLPLAGGDSGPARGAR